MQIRGKRLGVDYYAFKTQELNYNSGRQSFELPEGSIILDIYSVGGEHFEFLYAVDMQMMRFETVVLEVLVNKEVKVDNEEALTYIGHDGLYILVRWS